MLILPPCVMHTYYKAKHLQALVLLALNMLFSSFKKEYWWLYFNGYLCQVICAAEEQWFDSRGLFVSGVWACDARAQRLAYTHTQRKMLIKTRAWSCWAQMTLGPGHPQVAMKWSMEDHNTDFVPLGKWLVGNPWHCVTCSILHPASINASSTQLHCVCIYA